MKHVTNKRIVILFLLLFVLAILESCIPIKTRPPKPGQHTVTSTATETALALTFTSTTSPTASETDQPPQTFTLPAPKTTQPSSTFTPTLSPSRTRPPRSTRTFTPAATPTFTETLQPTETFTPIISETTQPTQIVTLTFTPCSPPTPETFWVEPVTSPTDQLTQVIAVYIGHGKVVTVVTESGTFTVTGDFSAYGNPALVEITLLPNTEHHLQVIAEVMVTTPAGNGCSYNYTLRTTSDKQGAPLTIIQVAPTP